MEKEMTIMESARLFIARVKADPDAFIAYIEDKPRRHRETVERVEKAHEARRLKALAEWEAICNEGR